MENLYALIRWLAETVSSGKWSNEWFEALIEQPDSMKLLREIGRAIVELWG